MDAISSERVIDEDPEVRSQLASTAKRLDNNRLVGVSLALRLARKKKM